MADSQFSSNPMKRYKKPPGTRRVWSRKEEDILIDCLKEIVVNGWKADNGFRPGYLGQLELEMGKKLPNANILQRHINSKLTVWKKTYGQIKDIVKTSGLTFNHSTNMVDIPANDVWEGYVKFHPEVNGFRTKTFPFYNDWLEIFGHDRANGEGAEQITDAILDLEHPHEVYDVVYDENVKNGAKGKGAAKYTDNSDCKIPTVNLDSENSDNGTSINKAGPSLKRVKLENSKKGIVKKMKSGEVANVPEQLISLLGGFFSETNTTLQDMATKIAANSAPPHPAPPVEPINKTKLVFDIVAGMAIYPLELRISVAHKIIHNIQNTELFLTMDEECRGKFVDMIVAGNI